MIPARLFNSTGRPDTAATPAMVARSAPRLLRAPGTRARRDRADGEDDERDQQEADTETDRCVHVAKPARRGDVAGADQEADPQSPNTAASR